MQNYILNDIGREKSQSWWYKKKKFDCAYLKQESNIISNVVSRASATRAFCPETAQ